MNGNQITISVNSDDFDQLRKIARTRGQTVSDYIACLVSSNLIKSQSIGATSNRSSNDIASTSANAEPKLTAPAVLKEARARMR